MSTHTFLPLHKSCRTRTDFELYIHSCWKSCYWQRDLKMATSPTELPPPPLFCGQSIQVSQQWPQPTVCSQLWLIWVCISRTWQPEQSDTVPFTTFYFTRTLLSVWMLFARPVHRSVNINPIYGIYVMLSFPAVPTYLTSYFRAASLTNGVLFCESKPNHTELWFLHARLHVNVPSVWSAELAICSR